MLNKQAFLSALFISAAYLTHSFKDKNNIWFHGFDFFCNFCHYRNVDGLVQLSPYQYFRIFGMGREEERKTGSEGTEHCYK